VDKQSLKQPRTQELVFFFFSFFLFVQLAPVCASIETFSKLAVSLVPASDAEL